MKLKKIEITGLWHEKDFSWDLNPDVNILVGGNGTGKSTILDLCCTVIPPFRMDRYNSHKADKIRVSFDNGYTIDCVNFRDSYAKLEEKAKHDTSYKALFDGIADDINERRKASKNFVFSASYTEYHKDGEPVSSKAFSDGVDISIVSTFDSPLPDEEDESATFKELKQERPISNLDKKLFDVMETYSYYIGKLANKIEKKVFSDEEISKAYITDVYAQKHLFENIMNELFGESGKQIDLTGADPDFILPFGKHISMYELSSGEKQILFIMMKVMLQEKQDCIMFLDEPELSLHVDWQEVLIDKIQMLNPNCQLIIATHSPSLLFDGWDSKVSNIDTLIK